MRPMADSRKRADVSSRTTAPDAWDAGLHAQSEAGPIDVGLSVEPSALGLIIDAPGIGLLKLAFDVKPDGTTRLSRASRRLTDGRDASLVAVDESKVLQLEGALDRLQKTHEELSFTLTTEREEARDRAAVLSEDRQALEVALEGLRSQLNSITADLQTEKDGRLAISAEREQARAELERVQEEQHVGSTSLMAELTQLRAQFDQKDSQLTFALDESRQRVEAALDAARTKADELESTQKNVAELAAALDEAREKFTQLEAVQHQNTELAAQVTELETKRVEAESAYLGSSGQISADLEAASAARAQLEAEVQALRAAREEGGSAQLKSDLEASYAARAELEAQVQTLQASVGERGNAQLLSELEASNGARAQLEAQLQGAQAAGAELEAQAQLLQAELSQAAETARAELEAAQARLETQNATLRAASTDTEALRTELDTLRASSGDSTATQTQLMAALEAANATLEGEVETLRAGSSGQAQLKADLEIAEAARATAEAELESTRERPTADPELETKLHQALARSEALQSQLAAAEARMGAESAATREARDVALKLKAQADKLQAERDEARALARQLHVKLAAPKKNETDDLRTALDAERQVAANLVSERDQLNLRIEALGRMIEQERDGRARALSERDEWQLRFKSLARGSADTSQKLDFSREETRSFMLERPTVPEMPAAKAEAVTDPAIAKKKGF